MVEKHLVLVFVKSAQDAIMFPGRDVDRVPWKSGRAFFLLSESIVNASALNTLTVDKVYTAPSPRAAFASRAR